MNKNLILLAMILLSSCSTKYQSKGFKGGYQDFKISPDTAKVSFKGNAYTDAEKVQKYLVYRSAELTKESGYDWFIIMDANSRSEIIPYQTRGSFDATTTYSGGTANTTGTYNPGQIRYLKKPISEALIKMGSGDKPENALDAQWILENLDIGKKPKK